MSSSIPGATTRPGTARASSLFPWFAITIQSSFAAGEVVRQAQDLMALRAARASRVLDIDRTWQFDTFGENIFGNDRADLAAPCLTWTTPITASNLGVKPDPWLYNKSLESIVSSFERGSPLGYCSHCHYQSSRPYSPDVLRDDEGWISDKQVIDGWRWSGPLGLGQLVRRPANRQTRGHQTGVPGVDRQRLPAVSEQGTPSRHRPGPIGRTRTPRQRTGRGHSR